MDNNTHNNDLNTNEKNERLDKALEDTFPASDPLSMQSSLHASHTNNNLKNQTNYLTVTSGAQYFASIGGALMLIMAVVALIAPGIINDNLPTLLINNSYGWFMGLIPMNIVNKLALIAFGITGLAVMRSPSGSVVWSRIVFVTMGLLAIMGLFPATNTMFGLAPLFSTQVPTYGLFSLLGLYFAATSMKYIQRKN